MGKSKMDVREGGGWKKHLNYCNIYILDYMTVTIKYIYNYIYE